MRRSGNFEQPDEMGAYDRYELKLGKKTQSQTSPLVKEWSDMLLFAKYKTYSVAADDKGKKHKAQGGRRVMYTSHHPCWDAKNRYGLDEELSFDYSEIAHIISSDKQSNSNVTAKEPAKEDKQLDFMNIPDGISEQVEFDPSPTGKNESQRGRGTTAEISRDSTKQRFSCKRKKFPRLCVI